MFFLYLPPLILLKSYALNELAFQSLPRGLRRRAASHNINRLPARLRAKAAKEVWICNLHKMHHRLTFYLIRPTVLLLQLNLSVKKSKRLKHLEIQ